MDVMALDTRQKRASALGFWNPSGPLPVPDGGNADTKAKRAMLLTLYSALSPIVAGVVRQTVDLIGLYSTIIGSKPGHNSTSIELEGNV